jgi:cytochrome b561
MWRNSSSAWGTLSKLLHWLVAALIAVQLGVGLYAEELPRSPEKLDAFVWHKSLGMLILLLVVIRLGWRLSNPVPAPAAAGPRLRRIAAFNHAALYALLLWLPLSGWLINSAAGVPVKLFWLIPLPPLTGPSEGLQEIAEAAHGTGIALLLALLVLHVAAALWHHLVLHDSTLRRMWFGGAGR